MRKLIELDAPKTVVANECILVMMAIFEGDNGPKVGSERAIQYFQEFCGDMKSTEPTT